MKVSAIDSNDKRRSCIVPMAQGAGIGAVAGYVAKYAQPLTPQEKNADYQRVINKINNQTKEYGPKTAEYLSGIKSKGMLSPAEDTFVKMFDGMKDGDKVKRKTLWNSFNKLEKPSDKSEFRRLCNESNEFAKKTAKQCIDAYNLVTKHIRPTSFYVITGAVIGALVALVKDVLKTDIKQS